MEMFWAIVACLPVGHRTPYRTRLYWRSAATSQQSCRIFNSTKLISYIMFLSCAGTPSSFSPSCHFSSGFRLSSHQAVRGMRSILQLYSSYIYLITPVSACLPVSFYPLFPLVSSALSALLFRLVRSILSFSLFSLQHLLLISLPVTHPCLCLCYPSHFSSLAVFPPAHSSSQPEWPGDVAIIHLNLLTTWGPFRTSEEISTVHCAQRWLWWDCFLFVTWICEKKTVKGWILLVTITSNVTVP